MLSKKTKTLVNKVFSYPFIYMLFLFTSLSSSGQCWTTMSAGNSDAFAIKPDGTLWSWGNNIYNQLGYSTISNTYSPNRIGTDTNWKSVYASHYFTLAIKTDGTLWSWGYNFYGQLGDGTNVNKLVPLQIGTSTWFTVATRFNHNLGIKTDGTLWAWGSNSGGQLGNGTTVNTNVPIQIGTAANWKTISVGIGYSLAIKADNTLWAWGDNYYGQLGDGTFVTKTVPTQIGTDANWKSVATGGDTNTHTLAIKIDGTLWAWGINTYGQLGDGTTINKTTPIQVGGDTNWKSVTVGDYHSIAIKTDGTLWGWGYNAQGQAGQGISYGMRFSPSVINGSSTNNQSIVSGSSNNLVLKTDGSLYGWGYNSNGEVGDGTIIQRYFPTLTICGILDTQEQTISPFSIYPNPAKDHITIDCGNSNNVIGYHIEIINALGQVIFNQPIITQQSIIEFNSWSNIGICFVKIFDTQNNLLTTRKILLQ